MRRCAEYMVAGDAALKSSSWQGAPAVRALMKSAYEVIAGIYNRVEPAFLVLIGELPPETLQEQPDQGGAGEPTNPRLKPSHEQEEG